MRCTNMSRAPGIEAAVSIGLNFYLEFIRLTKSPLFLRMLSYLRTQILVKNSTFMKTRTAQHLMLFLCLAMSLSWHASAQGDAAQEWWREPWLRPYQPKENVKPLSKISVKGNSFIDETGSVVIFKGLSISDPDKIEKNGHWNRAHFETIKAWGVTLVRIPVHPVAVHQRGLAGYFKLLDEAVDWCTELGIHVIIDWHTIGNLKMEMFQNEMYNTTQGETFNFWRFVSFHYRNTPTVAFYELFNEPTIYRGMLGACSWDEWKTLVEEMIDIIYAVDTTKVPLVAGFDWAYDLRPVREHPIDRKGIGYVTHPYPNKCKIPREPKWEEAYGYVADTYPVIATELGFGRLPEGDDYPASIMNYFNRKGISWTAWVFDPDWGPQMIKNWDYEPTAQGEFFRDVMVGKFKYKK
jgi:endoglucanase